MNAIVLNTLTGAVTEYSHFTFTAISPNHVAGEGALYQLGGDQDDGQPIKARFTTPVTLRSDTLKKTMEAVYLSIQGTGKGLALIEGRNDAWEYMVQISPTGVSRAIPGKGIRENYLGFGFANSDGAPFVIDWLEVLVAAAKTRRI